MNSGARAKNSGAIAPLYSLDREERRLLNVALFELFLLYKSREDMRDSLVGKRCEGCDFGLEPGDSIKLLSGTWKSSNTSVIVISKKGKATAVGEGTATLTSSTGQKLVIKVEED